MKISPDFGARKIRLALGRAGGIISENVRGESQVSRLASVYSGAEWVITASLLLYAVFAPHSIAVTEGSCLLGLAAWGVQLAISPRIGRPRSAIDLALFGFFACCVVSSFFSYDALLSIKGLKSPAFFLAFYLVSTKIKSIQFARFLVLSVIASCLLNVGATAQQLFAGRGVRIDVINRGSEFEGKGLLPGDVIVEADGHAVDDAQDLIRIVDSSRGPLKIRFERSESLSEASVSRQALREYFRKTGDPLGLVTSPGRDFRVKGFYSHYETYAEVLQMIAALGIGLLVALPRKRSLEGLFLSIALVLVTTALVLTATRAAFIGLAIAAAVITGWSRSKRAMIAFAVLLILVAPAALYRLERSRGSAILTPEEGSSAYRFEVWREALGIIKDHPLVGIGKGSEAKLRSSLELYDGGRLPPGHFHSTLIQVATWWGLPALIFYGSFMAIFLLMAGRLARGLSGGEWKARGIALGTLGSISAFNVSSIFHFNFGDGEVVMALWLVAGILFAVNRLALGSSADAGDSGSAVAPLSDSSEKPRLRAASGSSLHAAGITKN